MTTFMSILTTSQMEVDTKRQPGHTGSIQDSPVMVLPMEELRLPGLLLNRTSSPDKPMETKRFMSPCSIKVEIFITHRSL